MQELTIGALISNLPQVLAFVDGALEEADCNPKAQVQLDIAVEEMFVNIAYYAYAPGTGDAVIRVSFEEETRMFSVTFLDSGTPFNPLERDNLDVTLNAEEREIGGLGIFMVRKSMDEILYAFENGQNSLTLKKRI